jgi:hypothetical protein
MPEIRGGDNDSVETLFGGKHFIDVFVTFRSMALESADFGDTAFEVIVPHIANGLEVEAGDVGHRLEEHTTLLAHADEGDFDLVSAAGFGSAKDGWSAENETCAGSGEGFGEKVPAIENGGFGRIHEITIF